MLATPTTVNSSLIPAGGRDLILEFAAPLFYIIPSIQSALKLVGEEFTFKCIEPASQGMAGT